MHKCRSCRCRSNCNFRHIYIVGISNKLLTDFAIRASLISISVHRSPIGLQMCCRKLTLIATTNAILASTRNWNLCVVARSGACWDESTSADDSVVMTMMTLNSSTIIAQLQQPGVTSVNFSKFCSATLFISRHRSTCCVQISRNLADGKSVKSCVAYLTKRQNFA